MGRRWRWQTVGAVLLVVLSLPLSFVGALYRKESPKYADWCRNVAEDLPRESPGLPNIIYEAPFYSCCCGFLSFYYFGFLALMLSERNRAGRFGVKGRFVVFFYLGLPTLYGLALAVDDFRWHFWVLAFSDLVAAAGLACAVWTLLLPAKRCGKK